MENPRDESKSKVLSFPNILSAYEMYVTFQFFFLTIPVTNRESKHSFFLYYRQLKINMIVRLENRG